MSSKHVPSSPETGVFEFFVDDPIIDFYLRNRQKIVAYGSTNDDVDLQELAADKSAYTISNAFMPARMVIGNEQSSMRRGSEQSSMDAFVIKKTNKRQLPQDTRQSPPVMKQVFVQNHHHGQISQRQPCYVSQKENNSRAAFLKGVTKEYGEEILSNVIKPDGTTMKDIMGNEGAKQALEESVILPTLNPSLFSGLREPCKGILLFGPPGNGKTMLAKAVANESDCTFFNISAAAIMSKWVGDAERLMQALFQVARNAQPSIIFIDEIDSLLSERTEGEEGASRRVKTEFLLQVDGCSTKTDDRILILGATNRPQELDDGVLRRFPRRIYIDLPDVSSRADLIRHNFQDTNIRLSDHEYDCIAQTCENYSFSDMAALCRAAAMFPLKGLSRDELQRINKDDLRPVTYQDMIEAMKLVRASTNKENIRKLKEFASEFA